MTFREVADSVRERLPGFKITYDVPRNAVAQTYKSLMSQFRFPEAFTETTLAWTDGVRVMAATSITGWRGRGVSISGGSSNGEIDGTWIQLDVPSVMRRRVLYDDGDIGQDRYEGRFVFGIWGTGQQIHTVSTLAEVTLTVGHYKSHELDDDDDVLLMNADFEEMVIAGGVLKVWNFLNNYKPVITDRYPPSVAEAQAYYNMKLEELKKSLSVPENISVAIPKDTMWEGVRQMRESRRTR
jgi:hypothetical protein